MTKGFCSVMLTLTLVAVLPACGSDDEDGAADAGTDGSSGGNLDASVSIDGALTPDAAGPAGDGGSALNILWNANATSLPVGERVTYQCLAGGSFVATFGTDTYTADSSICTAAVHAGLATYAEGGQITLEVIEGRTMYFGSTRNAVTTNNWGRSEKAFRFAIAGGADGGVGDAGVAALNIGWSITAASLPGGLQVTYRCLTGGTPTAVYGTDVYTADSSICGAAMHAGKTTMAGETNFTIEILAGQASYVGSTRNGVTSRNWDAPYPKSFRLVP